MYYVNRQQIDSRLNQIDMLEQVASTLRADWNDSVVNHMAQERALHIAIEIVTDVGSLLIDGFIMRDASSYEDIIEIIAEEQVIDTELHELLKNLVGLRKPLVQDYADWPRNGIHPLLATLDGTMRNFGNLVHRYLEQELPAPRA